MIGLTAAQRDCLEFVDTYTRDYGFAPTVEEIREGLGHASKGSVFKLLDRLQYRGAITRTYSREREITIVVNVTECESAASRQRRLNRALGANVPRAVASAPFFDNIKIRAANRGSANTGPQSPLRPGSAAEIAPNSLSGAPIHEVTR